MYLSLFVLGISSVVKLLPFYFLFLSLLFELLHSLGLFQSFLFLVLPLLGNHFFPANSPNQKPLNNWYYISSVFKTRLKFQFSIKSNAFIRLPGLTLIWVCRHPCPHYRFLLQQVSGWSREAHQHFRIQ